VTRLNQSRVSKNMDYDEKYRWKENNIKKNPFISIFPLKIIWNKKSFSLSLVVYKNYHVFSIFPIISYS